MSEETIGEVTEIPEVPKKSRKTLIAIVSIVIVAVASVGVFLWWYTQRAPAPMTHNLEIQSTPITGVQFTENGVTRVTSYFETCEEGVYTIVMPASTTVGVDVYNFSQWEDGSTEPTRTVDLTGDVTLTATYVLAPPLYNTYSKYGFSFEYPKGMSLSEKGTLESTATSGSGMVLGTADEDEYIGVGWLTTVSVGDLEVILNAALESMEAEGTLVDKGQLVTSTKSGHELKYQYFTRIYKGETFHGVCGVWYCDTNDRFYQLHFMHREQDVLSKYQQYLDSFVCH